MVLQAWYRDLARINRKIADARELIERQKAVISERTPFRHRENAIVLLGILNDTLQAMIAHRTNILMFVRIFPLARTDWEGAPAKRKRRARCKGAARNFEAHAVDDPSDQPSAT